MGGIRPTLDFLLEALASGKDVVTANKALWPSTGRSCSPGQAVQPRDRLRGERRRRHPDRPVAGGGPGGQSGPGAGGDRQRDLQLHPHLDDPRRPPLRRGPGQGPGARLRRGRPHARRRRHRHRPQAGGPGPARLRGERDDRATSPARGSTGSSRPTSPTRPSWAMPSSCSRWRSSPRPGWNCGSPPPSSGGGRRWPTSRGPYNAVRVVGDAVGDTLFYGRGPARCRPPRRSWPT